MMWEGGEGDDKDGFGRVTVVGEVGGGGVGLDLVREFVRVFRVRRYFGGGWDLF